MPFPAFLRTPNAFASATDERGDSDVLAMQHLDPWSNQTVKVVAGLS
jgi:hypothetical protein